MPRDNSEAGFYCLSQGSPAGLALRGLRGLGGKGRMHNKQPNIILERSIVGLESDRTGFESPICCFMVALVKLPNLSEV